MSSDFSKTYLVRAVAALRDTDPSGSEVRARVHSVLEGLAELSLVAMEDFSRVLGEPCLAVTATGSSIAHTALGDALLAAGLEWYDGQQQVWASLDRGFVPDAHESSDSDPHNPSDRNGLSEGD